MPNNAGPNCLRYFNDIVVALKALSPDQPPGEVKKQVAVQLAQRGEPVPANLETELNSARSYLARAGYLKPKSHGIWALTDRGKQLTSIDDDRAQAIYQDAKRQRKIDQLLEELNQLGMEADRALLAREDSYPHRDELRTQLHSLSFEGFERLCQRLLVEAGFQQVEVTGQPGDKGIDGRATFQINSLLNVRVVFQCKHHIDHIIGPHVVREFCSAMTLDGAHHGIIFTISDFTEAAKADAAQLGNGRLQLVDGITLIELLERYELGVEKSKLLMVTPGFFAAYQKN